MIIHPHHSPSKLEGVAVRPGACVWPKAILNPATIYRQSREFFVSIRTMFRGSVARYCEKVLYICSVEGFVPSADIFTKVFFAFVRDKKSGKFHEVRTTNSTHFLCSCVATHALCISAPYYSSVGHYIVCLLRAFQSLLSDK